MKYSITALLLCVAFMAQAQKLHVTAFAGVANYQGDLQSKRFTFSQSYPAFGAGLQYEISQKFTARANVTIARLGADDRYNKKNSERNLSFTSPVTDVHMGVEYSLFSLYDRRLTPYVFAGVSYFRFNPSAKDSTGRKVFLRPLSTEGQGFYQGRKNYSLNQFAIPFGGGVKFALSDNIRVGFEIGLRSTNTDYIDDVSTNYVDQALLLANRGQLAVDMAFRGDELKTGVPYPADGSQRGSAKNKDWYYFSGVHLSIRLNSNSGGNGGGKFKTGCPAKVL
jgi:hypothetical protein